jgi:hypothetical protein
MSHSPAAPSWRGVFVPIGPKRKDGGEDDDGGQTGGEAKRPREDAEQRVIAFRQKLIDDENAIERREDELRHAKVQLIRDRRDLDRLVMQAPRLADRDFIERVVEPVASFLSTFIRKWNKKPRVIQVFDENSKLSSGLSSYALVVFQIPDTFRELLHRPGVFTNPANIADILTFVEGGTGNFRGEELQKYFQRRAELAAEPGSWETDKAIRALDIESGLPFGAPDRKLQNAMRLGGVNVIIRGELRHYAYTYKRGEMVPIERSTTEITPLIEENLAKNVSRKQEIVFPTGGRYDDDADTREVYE